MRLLAAVAVLSLTACGPRQVEVRTAPSQSAEVAIDFDRLRIGDETHRIKTTRIAQEAPSTKKKDAEKVGIGAGAGAVIGAIAGGKKGAAVGGAIGAGAGGGVVAATRGDEVRMAEGRTVSTRLEEPIVVRVPIK